MGVTIITEAPDEKGYFYSSLELPATNIQIEDALHKARWLKDTKGFTDINVDSCDALQCLILQVLESSDVWELNYFAERVQELSKEELVALDVILSKKIEAGEYKEGIPVKELINHTYRLNEVPVIFGVKSDEDVGQFVIENSLNEDVSAVPDDSVYLLDKEKIGKYQRESDGGVFKDGYYIATSSYQLEEVFKPEELKKECQEQDTMTMLRSMWLSDYIDINLGVEQGPEQTDKPDCPLIGADGNIFNLMGIASRTLKQHGMQEQSKEMLERVQQSGNYAEALNIIGEYVNIILSVKFGLYAAEELFAEDGKVIPQDGLIEIASCDKDGKLVFKTDVPVGAKLYVQEVAKDKHYQVSDTKFYIEFEYAGQDVSIVHISVNNGETIENKLIRESISGKKSDEDGNVVEGVVFGLFKADETTFKEETAILLAESDKDGLKGMDIS